MSPIKSIYKEDVDFTTLAQQDADFAEVLKSNGQLDFSNPESIQQLTKSLLKRDFGLRISLPPDRLCPPIPNRLNYLLWIQDLLDTTIDSYTDIYEPKREVLGLDIGSGASCIYPLLGCAQRPNWRFAGTDIDDTSLQFARDNIRTNNLQNRIKIIQTQPDGPLLPLDALRFENIDFSMCNPPFYSSKAEMLASAASKQRPPFTACTGSETEMVTSGGEVAFVSRIIEESITLCDRVQWYTSMLGKFSSLATLVQILREKRIDNYAVTEFVQGSKTRRWGIGWSFDDLKPTMEVARGLNSLPKALLPFPSGYTIMLGGSPEISTVSQRLNGTLSTLPLKWMWKPAIMTGVGFAEKNVWSRASRRRITEGQLEEIDYEGDVDVALAFKIHMETITRERENPGVKVTIRWLKGHDSVLFESFCGMLKRKLEV